MNDLDIESKFDPFLKLKMGKADEYLENERLEELKHQEFLKENQAYRDQLEVEVTQSVIKKMFTTNLRLFKDIWSGREPCERFDMYHLGGGSRQSLMHRQITDPFSDSQLSWTLELIKEKLMSNLSPQDQLKMHDFVWLVMLPEIFLRFYMDHFSLERHEALRRIRNTPLHPENKE